MVNASGPVRRVAFLGVIVLSVLVGLVFCPILGFEFVDLDTPTLIEKNPHIRGLTAENVKHIFTSWCVTSYYPARTLTYAVDYELWGLNPTGFKLTNGLIHLANVLLVFWLILRLLRREPAGEGSADLQVRPDGLGDSSPRMGGPPADSIGSEDRWHVAVATFSAGLFAVHPVVVEPVAWVPGREELLMTLGALACFHFHLTARRLGEERGGRQWAVACHAGAAFCCAVACLSNAVGAVVALLVVAWDLLTLKPPKMAKILWGTGVLWIIAATTIVLKKIGGSVDPYSPEIAAFSLRRLCVVLDVYWLNLKTLAWPTRLTIDYPRAKPLGFADAGVICGLIAVSATCALLWLLRRRKAFVFGVLWFGLSLGPTSQIIPHHIDRADRFLYLPLVGLAMAAAAGLRPLGRLAKRRMAMVAAAAAGVGGLLLPVILSAGHIQAWRNSLTLWKNCVELDPHNSLANRSVGDHLSDMGMFDQAIPYYERALWLDPTCDHTLNNYALRLATCRREELRDYGLAIRLAHRACELTEWKDSQRRHVLAMAYMNHATALKREGQFAKAIENYKLAMSADPDYEVPLFNLALLLATCPDPALRKPDEAVRLAEQACELLGQTNSLQLSILAEVYASAGRFDDAATTAEKAVGLAQNDGKTEWTNELRKRLDGYRKKTDSHLPED